MKEIKEDIPTYVEDYDDQDFVTESPTAGIPSHLDACDTQDSALAEDPPTAQRDSIHT